MDFERVSEKISVSINGENLTIVRDLYGGKKRFSDAKLKLLEVAVDNKEHLLRGMWCYDHPGFKITSNEFQGGKYVCFTKITLLGKKLPLDSFNLLWEECEAIVLVACRRKRQAASHDLEDGEPSPKKMFFQDECKPDPIEFYKFELKREEKDVEKSKAEFLNKDNCIEQGHAAKNQIYEIAKQEAEFEGVITVQCIRHEKEGLLPRGIVEKVYKYLLQAEYNERVKRLCVGCKTTESAQMSHSPGCVEMPDHLRAKHIRSCHLRITQERLFSAASYISELYGYVNGYVQYDVAGVVLQAMNLHPCEGFDMSFEYEFNSLYDM